VLEGGSIIYDSGLIPGKVKPKTTKLVLAASLPKISTKELEQRLVDWKSG